MTIFITHFHPVSAHLRHMGILIHPHLYHRLLQLGLRAGRWHPARGGTVSPPWPWFQRTRRWEEEREVARQRRAGRMIRSGRETGKVCRRRKRGGAKLVPSPLEKRREKELLLHLGPEGAPWGQPSETRALWTRISSLNVYFSAQNTYLKDR